MFTFHFSQIQIYGICPVTQDDVSLTSADSFHGPDKVGLSFNACYTEAMLLIPCDVALLEHMMYTTDFHLTE